MIGYPSSTSSSSIKYWRRPRVWLNHSATLRLRVSLLLTIAILCILFIPSAGQAQGFLPPQPDRDGYRLPATAVPPQLKEVGIDQRLHNQVPLCLEFKDESGAVVRLGDYFGGKPVLLTLVYYECPMLCTQILNGVVSCLKPLSFTPGKEFTIVTVSFDPRETPPLAERKKASYLERYGRPESAAGWHFLTGREEEIRRLTDAVGFRYRFDPVTGQYAHASGIMVLTPQGRLSRYFYGIEYAPRDLRLGLIEASSGKIGNPVDQVLLYCYHYDPTTGKYGAVVMNIIRAGGLLTFVGIALAIFILNRKGRANAALQRAGKREASGRYGESGSVSLSTALMLAALLPLFPEKASTMAGRVDALYFFLVAVSIFFAFSITIVIIVFAIRYRRKRMGPLGVHVEGSTKLEAVWIIVPFAISMVMFVWGASVYFAMYRQPAEALELYGISKQWMWKFQHPDGQREINELHVPIDRNIQLTIASEDVIHDFYVPAFRIKADIVPGRYTKVWFRATKPGRYHLFCAEYCGTQHSGMIGWVTVMPPAEYQAWLSGGVPGASLASAGEQLFQQLACINCHRMDGQGRGPVLTDLFGTQVALDGGGTTIADEGYLRESILNPKAKVVFGFQPIMPTFQGLVQEEQLLELIAYIKSMKHPAGAAPATAPKPQPAQRENP